MMFTKLTRLFSSKPLPATNTKTSYEYMIYTHRKNTSSLCSILTTWGQEGWKVCIVLYDNSVEAVIILERATDD